MRPPAGKASTAFRIRFVITSRISALRPEIAGGDPCSKATSMGAPFTWASSCQRKRVNSIASCTAAFRSNDTVSLRLAVRVKPWIRTTVSAASVAARSMLRKLVAVGASGFFMRRSWVRPRTTASRLLR